jgi:hypothetical protein
MLAWSGTVAAQQGPDVSQSRQKQLEVEKLSLEVARLKESRWSFAGVLGFLAGVASGVAGAAATIWVARRKRLGDLDQSVHDKRLAFYPQLVESAAPLAVYFPDSNLSTGALRPEDCKAIGRGMSKWYFEGGGLLLSVEARDAYFRLARALTRASSAGSLRVPTFPRDAEAISVKKLDEYRAKLAEKKDLDDVENWSFGCPGSEDDPTERKFQDYVFLQRLSSALRTKLTEDLRSRRRPS